MMKLIDQFRSDPNERSTFGSIHANRRAIGFSYRQLMLVAGLSVLTGLGQAAILVIVVRAATAVTAGTQSISGTVGPLSASDLSVTQLIAIGFAVLVVLLLAELGTAWAQANLLTTAQNTAQTRMLANYSGASYAAQTSLSRGDNQQIVFRHTAQAAGVAKAIGSGLASVVNFVTLVGSALVLSPLAGLVVMSGLLFMLLALRPLILLSKKLGGARANANRELSSLATERLELSREVKAFGIERHVDAPVERQIRAVTQITHRLRVVSHMSSAGYRLGGFAITLGMLAIIDASDATNLAALTGSLLMLLRSLSYGQAAQSTYQQMSEMAPVVDHLAAESARLTATAKKSDAGEFPESFDRIELEHVGFEYAPDDPVLHDVTAEISSGDFVALVGPSGSGKSTLMALLLRLHEPTSGQLRINGQQVADLDLRSWRRKVAYVAQDPKLESGTDLDAIRFHRREITDEDVREAARRAHIDHEIDGWVDGYQTNVGQLGENVSGGQRQRIAFARALAGNPAILLLDEPTSAVDPVSERLISQTLDDLSGEMTVIAIAHRLATVERANRVVLMREGRVVPHVGDDLSALKEFMAG